MAFTFQQVVDRARVPLNDSDKDRYSDQELLAYAVDALLMLYRYRPDLFIGSFGALPAITSITASSTFPSEDQYLPVVADYVTGRAESKDDEAVDNSRAAQFMALFNTGLRSP